MDVVRFQGKYACIIVNLIQISPKQLYLWMLSLHRKGVDDQFFSHLTGVGKVFFNILGEVSVSRQFYAKLLRNVWVRDDLLSFLNHETFKYSLICRIIEVFITKSPNIALHVDRSVEIKINILESQD